MEDTFGLARSSVHRWLKAFFESKQRDQHQAAALVNKAARQTAELIREIVARDPMWGHDRIATML